MADRICSFEGCNRKHHAKGYCKYHYMKFILSDTYLNKICIVPGCTNHASYRSGDGKHCEMHYTRQRRHGDVKIKGRERNFHKLSDEMLSSGDPLNFHIPNRSMFAYVAIALYGNVCMKCGWTAGRCEVHHKTHVKNGGKNTMNNAEVLCPNCHGSEHAFSIVKVSEQMQEAIGYMKNLLKP